MEKCYFCEKEFEKLENRTCTDCYGKGCTGCDLITWRCDIDNMPCDMCATVHVKFGQ